VEKTADSMAIRYDRLRQ